MEDQHRIPPITDGDLTIGWKPGSRVLGVSESFSKEDKRSIVVGVVMRGDLRIDGFGVCRPRVGGMDATEQLLSMFERMERSDIRAWLLGGGIISWFNVIDLELLVEGTGIPAVCVSYDESEGLEKYVKEYFPDDWEVRVEMIERSHQRETITLDTGHSLFVTVKGIGLKRAKRLLDLFTFDGRVPEPVRVARQMASALKRDLSS